MTLQTMTLREQLLKMFEAYAAAKNLSLSRISTLVFNGGHVVQRVAEGGDVTTARYESAMKWFAANWPAGTDWPEGIARPTLADGEVPDDQARFFRGTAAAPGAAGA